MDTQSHSGLSATEAQHRLKQYGHNVLPEKNISLFRRLVRLIVSPMSVMFVAAGVLSWFVGRHSDAIIIITLFVINISISFWHETKADTAVKKLKARLTIQIKVKRDNQWHILPSTLLVPGDVIELSVGSVIPADIAFTVVHNVSVNESAVTGESLPQQKQVGDKSYASTFIVTGLAEAVVTATGPNTYFGQTLALISDQRPRSKMEKDILSVSKFLSVISIAVMILLTAILLAAKQSFAEIATLDISLLIAGIPVALPTVMTLIISVGVVDLTRCNVIVRRLSSLEDLANVNLLLSDKTGTLTQNHIAVARVIALTEKENDELLWNLALAAAPDSHGNPLDAALQVRGQQLGYKAMACRDFIPGDSDRKRSTAFVDHDGHSYTVSLGAPQIIRSLCSMSAEESKGYDAYLSDLATEGYRVLALAQHPGNEEKDMELLALFALADAVRDDARQTIAFMQQYGITVKMVTGDSYDIANHVAHQLAIPGQVAKREALENNLQDIKKDFSSYGVFAGVLPKDKYDIVAMAQSMDMPYVVAVTGDGVNDLPAIKAANVGIAVANAVDALKGAADIVLMQSGISVIKEAIIGARAIFMRLYNYSVYRISESFRLIITVGLIGILYHTYPLTAVQLILIALLNDIPIVTMAFDHVTISRSPALINAKKRFTISTLFGLTGVANSMILLWLAVGIFHLPWPIIETLFFLKLTVSGHMLIYVAHTEKAWFKRLPAKQIIWATLLTQLLASAMAYFGIFMTRIPLIYIAIVWIWSFFWMQVSEIVKQMQ